MPELPEVETMRTQLEKFLAGSTIKDIKVLNNKIINGDVKQLIGQKIVKVRRFAKVTSIDFSNSYSILTHVKLTGQYIYRGPKLPQDSILSKKVVGGLGGSHTHIIFEFTDGGKLYYNDIRKFGWVKVIKSEELKNNNFIKNLGPEPHVAKGFTGNALTFDYFQNIISKSKRNIKVLLMDQTKLSGVGNIYANDALWASGISPKRISSSLNKKEQQNLYDEIHRVLKAGLKYGGASELVFVTPDGKEGEYQNHTLVYGHQGEICKKCKKTKIEKFFSSGRGTYWCSLCQK
jgi:formamidopyrimidine-DNA glycosylase